MQVSAAGCYDELYLKSKKEVCDLGHGGPIGNSDKTETRRGGHPRLDCGFQSAARGAKARTQTRASGTTRGLLVAQCLSRQNTRR
jgi:hypothetical protein